MESGAKRRRTGENYGTAGGASSTHTSTEDQEVANSSGYDYEVFLSFRGPDTRAGFTDFLYTSLKDVGIRTFRDDEELRVGEKFAPELLQAIKQSKISIPIFSKGYASSPWCLKELVQMVECQKNGRQKIMPIFYDVAPLEVRHQIGGYAEAFLMHKTKNRHDEKTRQEWMDALSVVGAIKGWDLSGKTNSTRREGEFAKEVTEKVFRELKKAYLVVSNCLVNVDNHVDAIMELIGAQTSETRIIGIYGMGGIGKTTTAKIIYNQLSENFEGCCFLSNIREILERQGIEYLQNQLIASILKNKCMDIRNIDDGIKIIKDRLSNKRVLLLFDDVHEKNHMDALVGERDWFGKGSKLLITTRNKEVLDGLKVDDHYELTGMDRNQSLQLFSKHAFRGDSPLDKYMDQSIKVIDIVKGLPLALEIIGSLLFRAKKKEWNDTLEKLENVPHREVQQKLKISYDALEDLQKHIFLDIACFFIGYDKDVMVHFWESNFFSKEALKVLQNMSLIKIGENNIVWMHDQLRDLGREIVRQESNRKIKERSRVWNPKEGLDLLRKHKGEKKVEALCLKLDNHQQYCFSYEDFENLSYLSFLEVDGSMENFCAEERLLWHESPSNVFPTNENSYLLPQLRWLSWRDIPPTFNITNFSMDNVVILDLSQSEITDDWKGWSHMKVLKNLKVLDMSNCPGLQSTSNFSSLSNLERLVLRNCCQLVEIDKSICQLKSLVFVDVSHCGNLRRLPNEMDRDLKSLKYLYMNSCNSLERLPNTIGNLESLIELDIFDSGIKELPDSIGNLELLNKLNIPKIGMKELPHSIGNLESLIELDISGSDIKELPNSIGSLNSLIKLDIYSTVIKELPDSIGNLESLIELDISGSEIKELPDSIGGLESLIKLDISSTVIKELPASIGNLESLIKLDISKTEIKELPHSIGQLKNLKVVKMNWSAISKIPNALWTIEKLEVIEAIITSCHFNVEIGNCICKNRSLRILKLYKGIIYAVPRLPESLTILELSNLYMSTLLDLSNLTNLKELDLRFVQCDYDGGSKGESNGPVEEDPMPLRIGSLHGESDGLVKKDLPQWIGNLSKLKSLRLWCPNLRCLPSLPSSLSELDLRSECVAALPTNMNTLLPRLETLELNCPDLRCLPSLPSSLSSLRLTSKFVTTLPTDMSLLPRLKRLLLDCPNLHCLPSLPSSLLNLYLDGDESCCCRVEDPSNLNTRSYLYMNGCAMPEI